MFEDLSLKLETIFKKIKGQGRLTESNISDSLREVRRALLDADVSYKVVKQFIEEVQKKAIGQEVINSITPGQLIIKIINDELIKLMGSDKTEIKFSNIPPSVILLSGLQGSGKTTFAAKLANLLKKKGRHPILVACDIYRPAAIDQLKQLGSSIGIPVYSSEEKDAIKIAKDSIDYARKNARDTVIIDTAGRLSIDEEMMKEIEEIKLQVKPHEVLFVVDSMTGQDAVNTAKNFHERLDFDGVVLTKLDGDTRGGAALSIKAVVDKPIKFVSIGEKLDAIEQFYPDRMASRILGMGDIVGLVEKAQLQFDEEEAKKLESKLKKNQFDFNDFLDQIRQMKKMGSLKDILGMLPGMDKALRNATIDDKALVRVEAIILSMTLKERTKPSILNGSRRKRIAKGSGTTIQEVNKVIKQYEEMQKMMRNLNKGKMNRLMKAFGLPAGFERNFS
ncbi:MAG TPA: signal recognition particle protein [Bacteroidota bacterium]|jgi:signal recognition particle subunit SRP54|nr:signal recognition particle protein [Bacteroidota bacterium]